MLEVFDISFTKMRHGKRYYLYSLYIMRENKPELTSGLTKSAEFYRINELKRLQNQWMITPYNQRHMTDIGCLIVYCLLSIVIMTAFFSAYILDKDDNIFKPRDPDYNKCGYDKASSYPYIYFPSPFAESIDEAVCVRQCPISSSFNIDCLPNSRVQKCTFNMTNHFNRSEQFIVYPTEKNTFLSMCQPSSRIIFDAVNQKINTHYLFMNLSNLYESMYVIIIACPIISILLVATYVFIITRIKDLTYVLAAFIVAFPTILIGFTIYSFLPSTKRVFAFMPYIGIAVFVIAVIFLAYIAYYRQHILESLKLLNLGAEYIRSNRSLIFLSIAFFLLWAIIFVLEIIALLFIYSMDSASISADDTNKPTYTFAYFTGIQNTVVVKVLMILAIVHYLWTNLILYSMGQYISMSAGSFWILNIHNNFKNALYTMLKFHLGTVVYASLVNIICSKLTSLLYFLMPRSNNRLCCCYLRKWSDFYRKDLFQKNLGIYNELNYIRVALKGQDLHQAGCNLTVTLVQHINHVSRAYRLARTVIFASKVLVAFTTTFICYGIMEFSHSMKGSFFTNIILFIISSFLVSFAFQSYDRSFEVILITILIKRDEQKKLEQQQKVAKASRLKKRMSMMSNSSGNGKNQGKLRSSDSPVLYGIPDDDDRKLFERMVLDWFEKQRQQEDEEDNQQRAQ